MSQGPRGKCAVCYVDPLTGRRGTNETSDICQACHDDPANVDWCAESDLDQTSADVDVTLGAAGGGRLEGVFGGGRKFNTELAHRVVKIAVRTKTRVVRRRRRNVNGHSLRGWVDVIEGVPLREIAKEAKCSAEYVRRVLRRLFR